MDGHVPVKHRKCGKGWAKVHGWTSVRPAQEVLNRPGQSPGWTGASLALDVPKKDWPNMKNYEFIS